MSNLEALLLGVVQGLTEFLPISSSGHLIIVPWLQDYTFLTENEAFNKTFDVALHAGTLIAAIAFFRIEVWRLIVSFIAAVRKRAIETSEERLAVAIAIGTVPAVIAGGLASDFIDEHLGEPWMIAVQLIFFGALLDWADRRPQRRPLEQTERPRRRLDRHRPGAGARPRHLALGDHDHRRPLPRPRPRRRRPLLLPAADPDRRRGDPLQRHQRGPRRAAVRASPGRWWWGRSPRRSPATSRSSSCCAWCAPTSYRPFVLYRYAAGVAILIVIATGLRPATF